MTATETTSVLTDDTAASSFEKMLLGNADTQQGEEEEAEIDPEDDAEDAPAEDSEDEQDSDEDPDEKEAVAQFTVKIDGKEQTVTADELVRGYQRTADYTRKTQEAAELRKTANAELEAAQSERVHYQQNLEKLQQMIQQSAPQEPDWIQLATEDPAEYVRQQALFAQYRARQQSLDLERQQLHEREQAEQERIAQHTRSEEKVKLLDAIPEWKDAKRLKADKASLHDFASSVGFTPEDIDTVDDHRVLVILRKAMLYDKAVAARSLRPVQPISPRSATPGAPAMRSGVGNLARAQQRFQKDRSDEAAADVFLHMMKPA